MIYGQGFSIQDLIKDYLDKVESKGAPITLDPPTTEDRLNDPAMYPKTIIGGFIENALKNLDKVDGDKVFKMFQDDQDRDIKVEIGQNILRALENKPLEQSGDMADALGISPDEESSSEFINSLTSSIDNPVLPDQNKEIYGEEILSNILSGAPSQLGVNPGGQGSSTLGDATIKSNNPYQLITEGQGPLTTDAEIAEMKAAGYIMTPAEEEGIRAELDQLRERTGPTYRVSSGQAPLQAPTLSQNNTVQDEVMSSILQQPTSQQPQVTIPESQDEVMASFLGSPTGGAPAQHQAPLAPQATGSNFMEDLYGTITQSPKPEEPKSTSSLDVASLPDPTTMATVDLSSEQVPETQTAPRTSPPLSSPAPSRGYSPSGLLQAQRIEIPDNPLRVPESKGYNPPAWTQMDLTGAHELAELMLRGTPLADPNFTKRYMANRNAKLDRELRAETARRSDARAGQSLLERRNINQAQLDYNVERDNLNRQAQLRDLLIKTTASRGESAGKGDFDSHKLVMAANKDWQTKYQKIHSDAAAFQKFDDLIRQAIVDNDWGALESLSGAASRIRGIKGAQSDKDLALIYPPAFAAMFAKFKGMAESNPGQPIPKEYRDWLINRRQAMVRGQDRFLESRLLSLKDGYSQSISLASEFSSPQYKKKYENYIKNTLADWKKTLMATKLKPI